MRLRAAPSEDPPPPSSSSVLSALCPLLTALGGGADAAAPRNRAVEVATSGFASVARLAWGTTVDEGLPDRGPGGAPDLVLYEFEACPFCRRVREALTQLDLDAEVRPCPKGAARHRQELAKEQFPFLVDRTAGVELYESEAIVDYLYETYGGAAERDPWLTRSTLLTGWMPTLLRLGRGMTRYPTAEPPSVPLELYNYEGNQFARLVREALCELEIPYVVRNVGKGSPKRAALRELDASASVPFVVDPNTGTQLGESDAIVEYLFRTYGGAQAAAALEA